MYIFKLKLSEKAKGYCMYVFLVECFKIHHNCSCLNDILLEYETSKNKENGYKNLNI